LQIEAVDYSPAVMHAMAARANIMSRQWLLQYQVMDAQRLCFRDSCFDVVIDKGCIDALLNSYDQEQWWISCGSRGECRYNGTESARRGRLLVREVARVLGAHSSTFVLISLISPKGRLHFLECPEHDWHVTHTLDEEHGNYIYVMTRGRRLGEARGPRDDEPLGSSSSEAPFYSQLQYGMDVVDLDELD